MAAGVPRAESLWSSSRLDVVVNKTDSGERKREEERGRERKRGEDRGRERKREEERGALEGKKEGRKRVDAFAWGWSQHNQQIRSDILMEAKQEAQLVTHELDGRRISNFARN
ncbi:hypothetical protein EYF80_038510 [Liparis tanakae]|uniref:Uncharacterized protein n=1 Tax=Liparis tanakae TaxID=230148 RepID=A0A4Z2GF53_9TELE|nr:hypothetical protein EYF80_038510 [Liparis tanakae]